MHKPLLLNFIVCSKHAWKENVTLQSILHNWKFRTTKLPKMPWNSRYTRAPSQNWCSEQVAFFSWTCFPPALPFFGLQQDKWISFFLLFLAWTGKDKFSFLHFTFFPSPEFISYLNAMEKKICQILSTLVRLQKKPLVGLHANFFSKVSNDLEFET